MTSTCMDHVDLLPSEAPEREHHCFLESADVRQRQGIVSRHLDVSMRNACAYRYHDPTVMMREAFNDEKFVNDDLRPYPSHVIEGLKARFPKESGSVLKVFEIFHLQSLPHDEKE